MWHRPGLERRQPGDDLATELLPRNAIPDARPVTLQPHRLVVRPRDGVERTTVARSLNSTPDADVSWTVDLFGNLIATATFGEPTDEHVIRAEAMVYHNAPEWPVFAIDPSVHSY